jgi:hypothetical protein
MCTPIGVFNIRLAQVTFILGVAGIMQDVTRVRRYWSDPIESLDQEETDACVGFSCTHWLAHYGHYLSPKGIYRFAKILDPDYEKGTSIKSGMEVLKILGFISDYHGGRTLKELSYVLRNIGPVVLALDVYEGMLHTDD